MISYKSHFVFFLFYSFVLTVDVLDETRKKNSNQAIVYSKRLRFRDSFIRPPEFYENLSVHQWIYPGSRNDQSTQVSFKWTQEIQKNLRNSTKIAAKRYLNALCIFAIIQKKKKINGSQESQCARIGEILQVTISRKWSFSWHSFCTFFFSISSRSARSFWRCFRMWSILCICFS